MKCSSTTITVHTNYKVFHQNTMKNEKPGELFRLFRASCFQSDDIFSASITFAKRLEIFSLMLTCLL